MSRILNILLVIAILCGAVLLVKRTSELNVLRAEHSRLSAEYGVLDVKDPSKFLITRIETNDPMHFLWRCYYPAGLRVEERCGLAKHNGGGMTNFTSSGEYLHRVRFGVRKNRIYADLSDRGGGGSQGTVSNAELAEFFKKHWSEFEIHVLAAEGTLEIDTDQALEFLTVRIPKKLLPELEARAGKTIADRYRNDPFYQALYGTPEAMADYNRRKREGRHIER